MARRGPKIKTAQNTGLHVGGFSRGSVEPTFALSVDALTEFHRLEDSLQSRGTLARCDVGHITLAAAIAAELAAVLALGDVKANIKVIGILSSQLRGLRRELGLTSHPSRSVVKVNPWRDGADDGFGAYRAMLGDIKA